MHPALNIFKEAKGVCPDLCKVETEFGVQTAFDVLESFAKKRKLTERESHNVGVLKSALRKINPRRSLCAYLDVICQREQNEMVRYQKELLSKTSDEEDQE